jgi:hypothetical protein
MHQLHLQLQKYAHSSTGMDAMTIGAGESDGAGSSLFIRFAIDPLSNEDADLFTTFLSFGCLPTFQA